MLDVNGGIKLGVTYNDIPGIIRFNYGVFEGYDGTAWQSFSAPVDNLTLDKTVNGTIEVKDGGISAAKLATLISAGTNEVLSWDGAQLKWISVSSAISAESVDNLTIGRNVNSSLEVKDASLLPTKLLATMAPATGEVLGWNATTGAFEWKTIASLASTEPDYLTIGKNINGSLEVMAYGVTGTQIATNAVTSDKLFTLLAPATGEVLSWNGTAMVWQSASAAASLEPDYITISRNINGSLEVMNSGISATQIATGAVTADKLNAMNAAVSGEVLSWNAGTNQFEWVLAGSVSTSDTWAKTGTNVHLIVATDNVAIGTPEAAEKLDVLGNINVSAGNYYKYNGVNFAMAQTDRQNYFTGNSGNLTMTGPFNTANGSGALASNVSGAYNTATGLSALGANDTGEYNTVNGALALSANTDGSFNTAVGYKAGHQNKSGSHNTFIGYSTGTDGLTNLNNATAIGYNAMVKASNAMILGGTGEAAVSVGIGTVNPSATLEVVGNIKAKSVNGQTILGFDPDKDQHTRIYVQEDLQLYNVNGFHSYFDADGNVGIGVGNAEAKLDVAGRIKISDDASSNLAGDIRYTGTDFEGYDGAEWKSFTTGGSPETVDNVTIGRNVNASLEVVDYGISSTKIGTGAVSADKLAASLPVATGEVLSWNGTALVWQLASSAASTEPDYITIGKNINGSLEVMNSGISAAKIATGAITQDAIASLNVPIASQYLQWNGSGLQWATIEAAASNDAFVQGGNTFTATAELGTKDNYPLAFKVNNINRMWVNTDGKIAIGANDSRAIRDFNLLGGDSVGIGAILNLDADDGNTGGYGAGIILNSDIAGGSGPSFIEFRNNNQLSGWIDASQTILNITSASGAKVSINSGTLEVAGGVTISNTDATVPGTMRYTGTDFEGYDGSQWRSFTGGTTSGEGGWTDVGTTIYQTTPTDKVMVTGTAGIATAEAIMPFNVVFNTAGPDGMKVANLSDATNASVDLRIYNDSKYLGALFGTSSTFTGMANKFGITSTLADELLVFAQSNADIKLTADPTMAPNLFIEGNDSAANLGFVGIGTSEPAQVLDVNGGIRLSNTASNTAGSIRYTGTDFEGYNGTDWQSFTSGSGSSDTWTRTGSVVNLLTSTDSVGIGTSEIALSTDKVYVRKDQTQATRIVVENRGLGDSTAELALYNDNGFTGGLAALGTNWDILPIGSDSLTLYSYRSMILSTMNNNPIWLTTHPATGADITIAGSGGNQGFVGISSSEPTQRLDVGGKLRLGDDATTANAGAIRFTGADFQGYTGTTWESFIGGTGSTDTWTKTGTNVHLMTSTNLVGIATTTPQSLLHVGAAQGLSFWFDTPAMEQGIMVAPNANQARVVIQGNDAATLALVDANAPADLKAMQIVSDSGLTRFRSLLDPGMAAKADNILVLNHDNGFVGVGTPTATQVLDVNGAIRLSNTASNMAGSIRFTGADFQGYTGTTWESFISSTGSSDTWTKSGTTVHLVTSTDHVGIGTSDAAGVLDVYGGTATLASPNGSPILISGQNAYDDGGDNNGGNISLIPGQPIGAGLPGSLLVGTTINNGNGAPLIIQKTTTGGWEHGLDVMDANMSASGTNLMISVGKDIADNYNDGQIYFHYLGDGNIGNRLSFGLAYRDDIMSLNGRGYVGIGTTNPAQVLDVNGGIKLSNTTSNTAGSIRFTGTDFQGYTGTTWESFISGTGSNDTWTRVATMAAVNLTNINDKVGIGTTNPPYQLSIYGTQGDTPPQQPSLYIWNGDGTQGHSAIKMEARGLMTANSTLEVVLHQDDGMDSYADISFASPSEGTNSGLRVSNDSGPVYLKTGGQDRLTVALDGGVTVASTLTASSGVKLGNSVNAVAGMARWTGSDFQGYTGTTWESFIYSGSYESGWRDDGTVVRLTNNSDRVGIGTLNPTGKLHVSLPGTPDALVVSDNGMVGYGVANPTSPLHVRGTGAGDVELMRFDNGGDVDHRFYVPSGSNISNWNFDNAGAGGALQYVDGSISIAKYTLQGLIINEDANSNVGLRVEGTGDQNLIFTNAGTNRVGIGTNLPEQKLHVVSTFDTDSILITNSGGDVGTRIGYENGNSVLEGDTSGNDRDLIIKSGSGYRWARFGMESNIYMGESGTNWLLFLGGVGSNKVGVGTLEPQQLLDVYGKIKIGNDATAAKAGSIRYAAGDFEGYNGATWKSFTSGSGSSDVWTRESSLGAIRPTTLTDKLGIGTFAPSVEVHISSARADANALPLRIDSNDSWNALGTSGIDMRATGATSDNRLRLWHENYDDNGSNAFLLYEPNQVAYDRMFYIRNASGGMQLEANGDGQINFVTASINRVTIANNGTVTVVQTLEANSGVKLGNSTSNVAGMTRFTGTDFEGYNGTTWESFTSGSGSSDVWTRNAGLGAISPTTLTDKVGIGTNVPAEKLHVMSTYDAASILISDSDPALGLGIGTKIGYENGDSILEGDTMGNDRDLIIKSGSGWRWARFGMESNINLGDNGANNWLMFIGGNGSNKVGIGTMEPQQLLDVNGKIRVGNDGTAATAGSIRYTGTDFQGYNGTTWESFTSTGEAVAAGSNGQLQYNNNTVLAGANLYYLNTPAVGDRLGVGASPSSSLLGSNVFIQGSTYTTLEVKGISSFPAPEYTYLVLNSGRMVGVLEASKNGGGLKMSTRAGGGATEYPIRFAPLENEAMRIVDSGRVGIGTTSPQTTLEVAGSIKIGNAGPDAAGAIRFTGTNFEGYDGSIWKQLDAQPSGEAGGWTDDGTNVRLTTITDNVGIGTAEPETKLSLFDSSAAVTGLTITNPNTAFGAAPAVTLKNASGQAEFGLIDNHPFPHLAKHAFLASEAGVDGLSIMAVDTNGEINMLTGGALANNIRVKVKPSGFVGIGSNEPTQLLDVNGGIRLSNTTSNTAGSIRYTGTDFEGYNGTQWQSFTSGSGSSDVWTRVASLGAVSPKTLTDKVGIGLTNPAYPLSIYGTESNGTSKPTLHIRNSDNMGAATNATFAARGGAGVDTSLEVFVSQTDDYIGEAKIQMNFPGDNQGFILNNIGGDLMLQANSSTRLTIFADGWVTASGTIAANSGLKLGNSANATAGMIRWTGSDFQGYTGSSWESFVSASSSGEGGWSDTGVNVHLTSNGDLVGIGTTEAREKLEVVGNLRISGNYMINGNSVLSVSPGIGTVRAGVGAGNATMTGNFNTLFGYNAGSNLTSGLNNVMIGWAAGSSASSAAQSVLVGSGAGLVLTDGTDNMIVGYNAGRDTTSGMGNAFAGSYAGRFNQTGNLNSFFGLNAGRDNTTGSNNVAIGFGANVGANNTNAIAIGYNATVSASNTMALGGTGGDAVKVGIGTAEVTQALDVAGGIRLSNTTSNTAGSMRFTGTDFQGYDGSSWQSFLSGGGGYWGRTAPNVYLATDSDSVGIGTATPVSKLNVVSSVTHTYPIPGQTTGSLHISPASDVDDDSASITFGGNDGTEVNRKFQGQAGIYAQSSTLYGTQLHFGTTNDYATGSQIRMTLTAAGSLGVGTTNPTQQLEITGNLGLPAFSATGGSPNGGVIYSGGYPVFFSDNTNLFMGNQAGNFTHTVNGNIGIGNNALVALTSGGDNVAIGSNAQASNQTATTNVAIGNMAEYTMNNGSYNVAVGNSALEKMVGGNYNVAIGSSALYKLNGGTSNTAIGHSSFYSLTTGDLNLALGLQSGYNLTTGSYNTLLGSYSDVTYSNQTYSTAIGYMARVSDSNCLALGGTGASAVRVSVGSSSADASAVLDLVSTNKGFLPPRMTLAQRNAIGSPANGLQIYNTDTKRTNYYDGSNWIDQVSGNATTLEAICRNGYKTTTSMEVGGSTIYTPSANNAVSAASGVTSAMLAKRIIRVYGNGGPIDITANPQIAAGSDGQIILLEGKSDTNTLKFDTGTGLALSGGVSFTMGAGDTLQLMYDSGTSLWYEISRSDN